MTLLSAAQDVGQKAAALAAKTPPAKQARRRRRQRAVAVSGGVLAAVLLLLAGGAWLAAGALAGLQPRLIAAVRDATGREVVLDGPLRWQLLPPRVSTSGLTLANLPDGSDPWMLRSGPVELQPEWLPLLLGRVRVAVLRLERPRLLLERTAAGPNWRTQTSHGAATGSDLLSSSWRVEARGGQLRLRAALPWLAEVGMEDVTLPAPELTLWQGDRFSAMRGTARLGEEGVVALDGVGGTLAGLRSATDGLWPMRLTLRTAEGGAASALGGLVPGTGAWNVQLEAGLPVLTLPAARPPRRDATWSEPAGSIAVSAETNQDVLRGIAPGTAGPLSDREPSTVTLRGLRGSARLTGIGADRPVVSDLHARLDGAAADGVLRGLALHGATLDLAEADGPARLVATGGFGDMPWRASLLARPGAAGGVALSGVQLESPAGNLSGALALHWNSRIAANGSLEGTWLDLDRLLAEGRRLALKSAQEESPFGEALSAPAPVAANLLPDVPLPLAVLRRVDAALSLRLGRVVLGNAEWRDLAAALSLRDSRLDLAPVSVQAPGGRASVAAELDAAAEPPTARLTVEAPSMALSPLLAALGAPPLASGTLLVRARLAAAGASLRTLASTLTGELRLALTEGAVRRGALASLLPGLAPSGSVPSGPLPVSMGLGNSNGFGRDVPDAGDMLVHGMSLALAFRDGQGTLRALSLDAPTLHVNGEGSLNLRDETLAVRLQPRPGPELMISGRVTAPLVAMLASPEQAGRGSASARSARGAAAMVRDAAPSGSFVPLTARNTPSIGVLDRLMRESLGAGN